jgi:hypothetical protein
MHPKESILGARQAGPYNLNKKKREIAENLILVADDKRVNLDALRIQFDTIDVLERCEFYANGQKVITRVKEVLEKIRMMDKDRAPKMPI